MSGAPAAWIALVLSISCSVGGQVLLKTAAGAPTFWQQLVAPRSLMGLLAYGLAALFYMRALRALPISVALPATAITYLGAAAAGALLFHERLSVPQMLGMALICGGVGLLVSGTAR